MPFLNDILMKGCAIEGKDETVDDRGCQKFVTNHIHTREKVLRKLEDARLTLSGEKSAFRQEEILVVGHLCEPYGRKWTPTKVDVIRSRKETCDLQSEVRRFLGACAFYHIWISHYVHIVDLLYYLLRKGKRFEWK